MCCPFGDEWLVLLFLDSILVALLSGRVVGVAGWNIVLICGCSRLCGWEGWARCWVLRGHRPRFVVVGVASGSWPLLPNASLLWVWWWSWWVGVWLCVECCIVDASILL